MEDKIVLSIKQNVNTKFSGINKLFDFHKEASQYYNETIYIDFYQNGLMLI